MKIVIPSRHERAAFGRAPRIATNEAKLQRITLLPKVDLHVHLVGTATPATVDELNEKYDGQPIAIPPVNDAGLFRPRFRQITSLVRDHEDVSLLVRNLSAQLRSDNVRYAEVTVTPHGHRKFNGMAFDQVIEGLEAGRAGSSSGVELAWVIDMTADTTIDGAWETARLAVDAFENGAPVVALGFAGVERLKGAQPFSEVFEFARHHGLHVVAHAGEFLGPDYVREVIRNLRPERIGHGTTISQDPVLLDHLVRTQTPLEVCLNSNLVTGAVQSLQSHPVRTLLRAGANIVLGSDDPALFGTSLSNEYAVAVDELNLSRGALHSLIERSIDASFLGESGKAALRSELRTNFAVSQNQTEMTL